MNRSEALGLGFRFVWDDEKDVDLSWCECRGKPQPFHHHTVLCLMMLDCEGNVVDSLGNIVDPSPEYSRKCEEEMAASYAPPATEPVMPPPAMMVETRYMGPTDHRGSRVSARVVGNHMSRKVVAWDHALGIDENHLAAAVALVTDGRAAVDVAQPLYTSAVDGGGRIFVFGKVR